MSYQDVINAWAASRLDKLDTIQHGIRDVILKTTTYDEYDDTYACVEITVYYYVNPGRTTRRKVEHRTWVYYDYRAAEELLKEVLEYAESSPAVSV